MPLRRLSEAAQLFAVRAVLTMEGAAGVSAFRLRLRRAQLDLQRRAVGPKRPVGRPARRRRG